MAKKVSSGFYDFQGIYRNPGEGFYDSQGIYRNPGEGFYDSQGIYRNPGEGFYDSRGVYVNPGEGFIDAGGIYRSVVEDNKDVVEPRDYSNSISSDANDSFNRYFEDSVMSVVSVLGHGFVSLIFIVLGIMIWNYAFLDLVGNNYFLWLYLPTGLSFIAVSVIAYLCFKHKKSLGFKRLCLMFAVIFALIFNIIGLFKFDAEMIMYIAFVSVAVSVIPSLLILIALKIADKIAFNKYLKATGRK